MASRAEIAARAAAVNATKAVETVAAKSQTSLNEQQVHENKPEIRAEIKQAILATPEMQNVLNTEHWWQKRSRWSFIVGIIFTVGAPVAIQLGVPEAWLSDENQKFLVGTLTTLGGLWASYLALRAGQATTPLGTSPTRLPYPLNRG